MTEWLRKDEYELDKAWTNWRNNTIGLPSDSKQAKAHPSYEEVKRLLSKIKRKQRGDR